MRGARALAAAALLALGTRALAQDSVLLEVQGKDKVLGSIRPVEEKETILGTLAKGTTLKAAVKSTQKTGPVPTLSVHFNDVPVPEAQFTAKGRGLVLVPFKVGATGVYKVVVGGDGVKDGDYQLAVAWTPQKLFSMSGTSTHTNLFEFSVPAHATVSITLAPGKGSAFEPKLEGLYGPNFAFIQLDGGGKARQTLPTRGDWRVAYSTAAADGPYSLKVAVSAPAPKKHTTDIRDSTLSGAFGGNSLVLGAVIDPGEGGLVGGDALDGTPLEGSSVQVPPDSLGQATTIFVAQSEPYTPPGGDSPAGPAVEFGPPGTEFDEGKPAVVTIPFDVNAFPGGPEALVVYVKDQKGDVVAVPGPYTFGAGTVTFTTSHFSVFQAATNAARGYPDGDYVALGIGGRPLQGAQGDVLVTTGTLRIIDLTNFLFLDKQGVHVAPASTNPTPDASPVFFSTQSSGRVQEVDDSSYELFTTVHLGFLRRGARDDVVVLEHEPGNDLTSLVFFKLPPGKPTLNSVAGRWHAFLWEFRGEPTAIGATTRQLTSVADTGTATISLGGEITFKWPSRLLRTTQYPSGDWQTQVTSGPTGTFPIDFGRAVNPVITFGTEMELSMTTVLGGDAMFGAFSNLDRDAGLGNLRTNVGVLFLVRESARAKLAALTGNCIDDDGGLQLHAPTGTPPVDNLGITWRVDRGQTSLAADRTFTQNGLLCTSGFPNGGVDPTFASIAFSGPASTNWSLDSDGIFTMTPMAIRGAVIPAGDFGVYLRRGGDFMTMGFLSRLRVIGGTKK